MKNKGGNAQHKMTNIPNLRARMHASNFIMETLATRAGVSKTTVLRACKGLPVRVGLAGCIEQALGG